MTKASISATSRKVLVVIPCKNEELTVENTLLSLLNQEKCEIKVVLVDDGSTDATADIVKRLALTHTNLAYETTSMNKQRNSGAGIAKVVQYGLTTVNLNTYDYVAKFDADLSFPEGYIDACLVAFEKDDQLGLVGGSCSIETEDGQWNIENVTNKDHIRGALKLYRAKAFSDIQGIVPATGWDTIDEHKLRFHKWTIELIPNLHVKQYRATNAATDPRKMAKKTGLSMYHMDYNLLVVTVSIAKRAFLGSPRLPLSCLLSGYFSGYTDKKEKYLSKEEASLANKYRMKEYLRKVGL